MDEPRPDRMDRRTFMRTAAAGVGAAAVLASPFALRMYDPSEALRRAGPLAYLGARRVAGPAPRGVPLIPLRVQADGRVEGVPRLAGVVPSHSLLWYAFCGKEPARGIRSDYAGDDLLRYHTNPARLDAEERELGRRPWYADRLGQPVRASDFTTEGQGAPVRWRSEGAPNPLVLTGLVIKVAPGRFRRPPPPAFLDGGLVAYASACTHLCCAAGYHESKIAREAGYWDHVYCVCHDAVFDPLDVRTYRWPPDARALAPVLATHMDRG